MESLHRSGLSHHISRMLRLASGPGFREVCRGEVKVGTVGKFIEDKLLGSGAV